MESLGSDGFFVNLLDSLEFSGDWDSLIFSGILLDAFLFLLITWTFLKLALAKRGGRCHAAGDVNLGTDVCVLAPAYLHCRSNQVISSLTLHFSTALSHEMYFTTNLED